MKLEVAVVLESRVARGRLTDIDWRVDALAKNRAASSTASRSWILQGEVLAPEMAPAKDPPTLKSATE